MAKTKHKRSFHDWLRSYGISRLAREAGLCRTTPYKWLNGKQPPGYHVAVQLQAIAANHNEHFTIQEIIGGTN